MNLDFNCAKQLMFKFCIEINEKITEIFKIYLKFKKNSNQKSLPVLNYFIFR